MEYPPTHLLPCGLATHPVISLGRDDDLCRPVEGAEVGIEVVLILAGTGGW